MLVTKKINIFSFFFGKAHAASNVKARSVSKAQNLNDTTIDDLNERFTITKNDDYYNAQAFNVISPVNRLNR